MQQVSGSEFRPEEIVTLRHYNQKTGQWIENDYPKISGRLRLLHQQNESLDISTEVIQYDGSVAVVKATVTTQKGTFTGYGMASVERDAKIAPAILELAETRSVVRASRHCGIGVEFCSAEEVSHLEHEKASHQLPPPPPQQGSYEPQRDKAIYCPATPGSMRSTGGGGYGSGYPENNGQGQANNGNGRLSQKQHALLLKLADNKGLSRPQLDDMSKERFGCVVGFISKGDASSLIGEMTSN